MSWSALPASFEYLCYGCTTIRPINLPINIFSAEIDHRRQNRRQILTSKVVSRPCIDLSILVRSKYCLTPKKLLQKVSQLIPVGVSVLYNILKVYQSWTLGKVFFSRWRSRWPPKPLNDHN